MLVSLEVFRGRPVAGPVPSGPAAFWFPCPRVPVPSGSRAPWFSAPADSRIRRPLGSPPPRGCALRALAMPAARPRQPVTCRPWSVWPCSRPPPRCPDRQFGLGCRPGPRAAAPARAGLDAGRPASPANMTFVSVNGSQSRPGPAAKGQTGWRCTVAYRLRSVTSPGKRAGRASGPPLISLRCSQFVTHLKHIPVAVTLSRTWL